MSERPSDEADDPTTEPAGAPEPAAEAMPGVAADAPGEAMAKVEAVPEVEAMPEVEADDEPEPEAESDDELADDDEGDEPTVEEGDAELQGEEAPIEGSAEPATTRPMRPSERRAMRSAMDHSQLTIDPALRITDRASAIFVLVTVVVFVGILLNGIVLGKGGILTPLPTPTPIPTATAAPSPSPAASGSAVPTITPAPSASPTAS
jgi:hypothetical protein